MHGSLPGHRRPLRVLLPAAGAVRGTVHPGADPPAHQQREWQGPELCFRERRLSRGYEPGRNREPPPAAADRSSGYLDPRLPGQHRSGAVLAGRRERVLRRVPRQAPALRLHLRRERRLLHDDLHAAADQRHLGRRGALHQRQSHGDPVHLQRADPRAAPDPGYGCQQVPRRDGRDRPRWQRRPVCHAERGAGRGVPGSHASSASRRAAGGATRT